MRCHCKVVAFCVVWLIAIPCLGSEIIRGSWEKVRMQTPGTAVVVKLKAGDRVEGQYQALDGQAIRIKDFGGSEVSLPKQSILSISTAEMVKQHRLRNGAIWGAVIGAPVGILAGFMAHSAFGGGTAAWSSKDKQLVVAGGVVMGGIGAGIGMLVNSRNKDTELHTKNTEVLYMAEK